MALLLCGTLAGCDDGPVPGPLPPAPREVAWPDQYGFGDATAFVDQRAQFRILDQLEAEFGKTIRIIRGTAPATIDPERVEAHYERELITFRGWKAFPLTPPAFRSPFFWAAAYRSSDKRAIIAIVALNPDAGERSSRVPFSILTNIKAEQAAQ